VTESATSIYEQVGGEAFFADLVADFYRAVAADDVLRPMYPDEDLAAAQQRLQLFLEQYWGGPTNYQALRGHPRLRMRHAPFTVDEVARDHWLQCMRAALDNRQLPPELELELWSYFAMAAQAMLNRF
jgi:hemoglobin